MTTTNTDTESDTETETDELTPAEQETAAIQRLVEEKDRRRREASAPLDLEHGDELRTGSQQKTIEVYQECLDRGLDDVAAALQDAPTETEQRNRATTVRASDFQVTADELEQPHLEVRKKYRDYGHRGGA